MCIRDRPGDVIHPQLTDVIVDKSGICCKHLHKDDRDRSRCYDRWEINDPADDIAQPAMPDPIYRIGQYQPQNTVHRGKDGQKLKRVPKGNRSVRITEKLFEIVQSDKIRRLNDIIIKKAQRESCNDRHRNKNSKSQQCR